MQNPPTKHLAVQFQSKGCSQLGLTDDLHCTVAPDDDDDLTGFSTSEWLLGQMRKILQVSCGGAQKQKFLIQTSNVGSADGHILVLLASGTAAGSVSAMLKLKCGSCQQKLWQLLTIESVSPAYQMTVIIHYYY